MAYPELTLHHTHRDTLVRCTTTRATLPALLLRAYLPAYPAHLTRRHQLDLSATYIPASPLTTHDLLRSSQVTRACHALIDALALAATSSSSSSPSLPDAADAHLADALARAQLEDRRAGAPSPRGVRNQRTLATFLVFADVSRAFRSRRLGGVLARFFARHGARMLAGDDDRRYCMSTARGGS